MSGPTPKVRMLVERAARSGHAVTVIWNLPGGRRELDELVRELRRTCATGGAVRDDRIELRGDVTDRVAEWLDDRGWPYERP